MKSNTKFYSFWGADSKQIVPISHFNVSSFNHQKTATKRWLLSSFEEDNSYLFNSQPIFTCVNDSENIILCLVQGSRLELCPVPTFATYSMLVFYYTQVVYEILWKTNTIKNKMKLNTIYHVHFHKIKLSICTYFPFLCRL